MDNLMQHCGLIELRGIAALLFGLAALLWLGLTLLVLIPLLSLYAVVNGIRAGITGFSHAKDSVSWKVFLFEGFIGIAAGIIALVRPEDATLALVAIIATRAILIGMLELVAAIRLHNEIPGEWLFASGSILSIMLGAILILQPVAGSVVVVWAIGTCSLIFGTALIALGFRIYRRYTSGTPMLPLPRHST
jgi:uncharacterized membrane protein HdeD (DUF308 family)